MMQVCAHDGSLIYKPSDWGMEYHSLDSTFQEALGAGAAGPGKSMVLLFDPFQQITMEHARQQPEYAKLAKDNPALIPVEPGYSLGHALHLRRIHPMLEETISRAQRMFPRIDPGVTWKERDKTFRFSSGFKYQFGSCKNTADWKNYYSTEFSHIAFDETTQFEEEQYDQITTRLRSSDPILSKMCKVRCMSNPVTMKGGGGFSVRGDPHWVRRRFVAPAPEGRRRLTRNVTVPNADGTTSTATWGSIYLPATLFDNPDKAFVEAYKLRLASKPDHIKQALLYGDWFVKAGGFYETVWNRAATVRSPFRIPSDWRWFRSMDWGFREPGCVHWWALSDDDALVGVREMWFQEKTAAEVATLIRAVEIDLKLWDRRENRSKISGPADTQLWEERGDVGETKAESMARRGVSWVQADKRSRLRNAALLYSRLKRNGSAHELPGLVLFSTTMQRAIEVIPAVGTDPRDPEQPEDGPGDHAHDSLLYACAYAQRPARIRPIDDDEANDPLGPLQETVKAERPNNRYGYGDTC